MKDVIFYTGTDHTARLIGDHHNYAGMWEASFLPGVALNEPDADFAISIMARFASTNDLRRNSVLDFAERNGVTINRIVANLDGRPGCYYITGDGPGDLPTVHTWHLQRDIYDNDRPAHAVGWEVWRGGWREVRRHPWHVEGLTAIGEWAFTTHAANRNSGCPPTSPDEPLASALTAFYWQTEHDHRAEPPIVTCDQNMQLAYQVDCSCGAFSSGWRHTEQLARRDITDHREQATARDHTDLTRRIVHARQLLAERYPVKV